MNNKIYPIKINFKNKVIKTDLEKNKKYKKIINKFVIPDGLYIFDIFSNNNKKKLDDIKNILDIMYTNIIGPDYKLFQSVSIVFQKNNNNIIKKRNYNHHYRKFFNIYDTDYNKTTNILDKLSSGFKPFLNKIVKKIINKIFDTKKYDKKKY